MPGPTVVNRAIFVRRRLVPSGVHLSRRRAPLAVSHAVISRRQLVIPKAAALHTSSTQLSWISSAMADGDCSLGLHNRTELRCCCDPAAYCLKRTDLTSRVQRICARKVNHGFCRCWFCSWWAGLSERRTRLKLSHQSARRR